MERFGISIKMQKNYGFDESFFNQIVENFIKSDNEIN
jgi:hypothetical protein